MFIHHIVFSQVISVVFTYKMCFITIFLKIECFVGFYRETFFFGAIVNNRPTAALVAALCYGHLVDMCVSLSENMILFFSDI